MQDSIEKTIELNSPPSRVWRALTDYREFGEWFRVKLEGPFVVGEVTRGLTTYPGYENLLWKARVVAMEPEKLFSFTWCPLAEDPDADDADELKTLVEFRLEPTLSGTRLFVVCRS